MSSQITDLLSTADAIAAHLADLPELDGVTLLVDRQKDLENEIAQGVAKAGGAVLLIEPTSGRASSTLTPLAATAAQKQIPISEFHIKDYDQAYKWYH